MKRYLLIFFILIFSIASAIADHEDLPVLSVDNINIDFDSTLIEKEQNRKVYNKKTYRSRVVDIASKRAKVILNLAYSKTDHKKLKQLFKLVHHELVNSIPHWPRFGYDFVSCDDQTLAYAVVNGNDIYLCARVFSKSIDIIAQILIHESIHLNGVRNECITTRIEAHAMINSGIGLQFKNAYFDQCNI